MIKGESGKTCNIMIKNVPIEIKKAFEGLKLGRLGEENWEWKQDRNAQATELFTEWVAASWHERNGLDLKRFGIIVEDDQEIKPPEPDDTSPC